MPKAIVLAGGKLPERFEIILSKEAQKYYKRIPLSIARRLDRAFVLLEENPISGGDVKPLKGDKTRYCLRIGDLRVTFQINKIKRLVLISTILPRGQAYK